MSRIYSICVSPKNYRYASNSASVGVGVEIPSSGISILAVQAIALRMNFRSWSSAQFRWRCPPVKPNPRPPSGRSTHHPKCCGSPFATDARTCGFPLCGPSGLSSVDAGAIALNNGCHALHIFTKPHVVIPFIFQRKRLLPHVLSGVQGIQ